MLWTNIGHVSIKKSGRLTGETASWLVAWKGLHAFLSFPVIWMGLVAWGWARRPCVLALQASKRLSVLTVGQLLLLSSMSAVSRLGSSRILSTSLSFTKT